MSRDRVLIKFHPEREPDPTELLAVWNAADQLRSTTTNVRQGSELTLAREDEVAGMKWAEIDSGLWRIPAERHKGKRGHDVPMPAQALELLEALPRVTDHVFYTGRVSHIGDFSGVKAEIDPLSGVPRTWRWHDLRRVGLKLDRRRVRPRGDARLSRARHGQPPGRDLLPAGPATGESAARCKAWADYVIRAATRSKVVDSHGSSR